MEPTVDRDTSPDDESTDGEITDGESTGQPEVSAEPDEQVALDRLTAAFAELLGSDDASPDEDAELSDDSEDAETEAGDEPATLPLRPPTAASPVGPEGPPEPITVEPSFPISPRGILEAMLFVGDPENRPLSPKLAAARLRGVSPREIESLLQELNETYRSEGCPYVIESSGEGYQLVLRPEFASVRERFYGRIREARLSQFAIDVLALVAYHQPITKPRVEEIRGKPSGGVLSQLVRRQLLRIERIDSKPRVTRYYTTDRFLDLFALGGLGDLPRTQDLDRSV
jgi:segregation and condensation protein B